MDFKKIEYWDYLIAEGKRAKKYLKKMLYDSNIAAEFLEETSPTNSDLKILLDRTDKGIKQLEKKKEELKKTLYN